MDKNSVIGFTLIAAIFIGFSVYESGRARKQAEYLAQQDSIARANMPVEEMTLDLTQEGAVGAAEAAASGSSVQVYKDTLLNAAAVQEGSIVAIENSKIRVEFNTKGAQPYSDSCVVMRLPFSGGGYIEQRYSLSEDSYMMHNMLSFVGMEGVIPRNVNMYDLDFSVTIPRMEKGYKNELQYSKLDYYYEGDKKPEEMGRGRNASKRIESSLDWFAFQQQFFSVIVHTPQQFASGDLSVNFFGEDDPDRNLMACSARMRLDLPDGAASSVETEFYLGPNHFQTLNSYDNKYEKIIPLGGWLVGWFTRYAIIPMFNFFSRFIDSFGLIILLMTLVIKIVVFPLTYKSYASSAKMSALRPEIEKINARYPHMDNQQEQLKKQQAIMNLYKRAGASPMGGCLPMLLTFPILWAMFRFFPASIELRQHSWP